jgi:phosphatidylserine/phosphatidylglycerophosphate/cardiolipin synthase-like enzyme
MTRPAEDRSDDLHKQQIRTLHKLGFQIELEGLLHAKLLLVDDSELLIGSANLVATSMKRNYEVALWTNHHKTVQDAKVYFTELMDDIFTRKLSE